jgi:hypothetical protein
MSRRSGWGRVAFLAVLGMAPGLPAAHAAVTSPTVAVHTATAVRPHPARHHRHRHATVLSRAAGHLAARAASSVPPARPARRSPNHHGATLPRLARGMRHGTGSKTAPQHAWMSSISAAGALLVVRAPAGETLVGDSRKGPLTSGRGPPRASPTRPSRGRATTAPASALGPDARSGALAADRKPRTHPAAHPVRADLPTAGERFRLAGFFLSYPRPAAGRLHADRPEGATACSFLPSIGGTPCPASPYPRSRSRSVS